MQLMTKVAHSTLMDLTHLGILDLDHKRS
jgi:hypothetical protein